MAVKELLNAKGKLNLSNGGGTDSVSDKQKSLFMRKTVSVPNMSHVSNNISIRVIKTIISFSLPCICKNRQILS